MLAVLAIAKERKSSALSPSELVGNESGFKSLSIRPSRSPPVSQFDSTGVSAAGSGQYSAAEIRVAPITEYQRRRLGCWSVTMAEAHKTRNYFIG
jgi:hypothetical protein